MTLDKLQRVLNRLRETGCGPRPRGELFTNFHHEISISFQGRKLERKQHNYLLRAGFVHRSDGQDHYAYRPRAHVKKAKFAAVQS